MRVHVDLKFEIKEFGSGQIDLINHLIGYRILR